MKSVNVEDLMALRTSSFQPFGKNGPETKKSRKNARALGFQFLEEQFFSAENGGGFFSVFEITVMDSS